MPWNEILVLGHLVGAALGVGAASASDVVFLRSIRHRRISSEQFVLIRSVADVVLLGMALVALTGVGLLLLGPELIAQAKFQAKMLAVLALIVNGLVFHLRVLPWLMRRRDTWLGKEELTTRRRWFFATTGAVSAVSWYTALILGAVDPVGLGLITKVAVYVIFVVTGAVTAFLVLSHLIFAPAPPVEEEATETTLGETPAGGIDWEVIVIAGLLVLVLGALAVAGFVLRGFDLG